MRILAVNYEWPGVTDNCGGGGRIGKALADGLRERGHTVEVFTDDADGHYATFPFRTYRALRETMADFDPDVVHGQFSVPSSLALPRLCGKHGVPLVVTPMGADVFDPTRYHLLRPLLDRANARIFSRADKLAPPSRDMGERLPRRFQSKSRVIHYGIDPARFTWRSRERHTPLRVLTICRLVPRKNLPLAARAIERYWQDNGPVRWRVVGKGPMADYVQDTDVATARGYVDDLQAEMDWADVFFLPSKHEAFGIVFLEALAAGLPVVTSDTGGQTDIVEQGMVGQCAPPNPKAQTRALYAVARDYNWYQQNTREYVDDRFSRTHMVQKYEQLFQEVHERDTTRVLRRRDGNRERPVPRS